MKKSKEKNATELKKQVVKRVNDKLVVYLRAMLIPLKGGLARRRRLRPPLVAISLFGKPLLNTKGGFKSTLSLKEIPENSK